MTFWKPSLLRWTYLFFTMLGLAHAADIKLELEEENEMYKYTWPSNGSGAFWTTGNSCIVRRGKEVYATGIEHMPKKANPNNVRWVLFKKTDGKMLRIADGGDTSEREPCPIGALKDGTVLISSNPVDAKPRNSTAKLLFINPKKDKAELSPLTVDWGGKFQANQHSYRSFSVDAENNTSLLFYQNPSIHQTYWACYEGTKLIKNGKITYPRGMYGKRGVSMRICYAASQIKDWAAHYVGVSDIQEPVEKFRGMTSSWVFRRLYYIWSPDVRTGKFSKWVEIANYDEMDGYTKASDILIESKSKVWLLWYGRELSNSRKIKAAFPTKKKQRVTLYCSLLSNGKLVSTKAIYDWKEGQKGAQPGRWARFHTTPAGKRYVLYYAGANYIVQVKNGKTVGKAVKLPIKNHVKMFFIPTVRNGSTLSNTIEMIGQKKWARSAHSIYYFRIKIK
ncbi:MAG: hypothetical protein HRT89_06320 [Lentisphaeria bacterium]|nr:hypothetical protein [Lentisphaeria bacterium]NQZ67667.1 hypothetical protein [Lentisphaeria bacterium]